MNGYLERGSEWQLTKDESSDLFRAITGYVRTGERPDGELPVQMMEDFLLWQASKRLLLPVVELDDQSRGISFWLGRTISFEAVEVEVQSFIGSQFSQTANAL